MVGILKCTLLFVLASTCLGCGGSKTSEPQAVSLLGKKLYAPELDAKSQQKFEENLKEAKSQCEANPSSADALIWHGRRSAYLGRYKEAISIFTKGIAEHPGEGKKAVPRDCRQNKLGSFWAHRGGSRSRPNIM